MGRYKLIGKLAVPCEDLLEWGRWFETADRHVDLTQIGPLTVSTVFLGLDHSFGEGEPLLFETMIFGAHAEDEAVEGYQDRYPSWAEAGHARAVEVARQVLAQASAQFPAQGSADS